MFVLAYESALVLDFDGTIANTFEPSPSGLGVKESYEIAVRHLFGQSALNQYDLKGGLRNRSPREVVVELQLAGFGKGLEVTGATDELVGLKIDCLINQIGQTLDDGAMWPRLTTGFADFWKQVVTNTSMFTAIVSSGHRAFIEKTFLMHGLGLPKFMVTDDELRSLPEPLSKPDPRLWQHLLDEAKVSFPSAFYIGDDQAKDGGLARNARVPFLHFAPVGAPGFGCEGSFADWRDIIPRFVQP